LGEIQLHIGRHCGESEKISMMNKIRSLQQNDLIRGTAVIFLGSIFVGIGNYAFNIIMGRLLGPVDYGILASLLALTYIINVPSQTVNLTVSHHVAQLSASQNHSGIKSFFQKSFKRTFIIGIFSFAIFLSISFFLQDFLHLPKILPLIILGLMFLLSFASPVITGTLGGMEKFGEITTNNIINTIAKIVLGIILLAIGWKVDGAMFAVFLAFLIATVYSFYKVKIPADEKKIKEENIDLFGYGKKAFLVSLCLVVLYNIDVVLAKHFLDATQAGYYATLSLLGKLIFFATSSVGIVTFPLSAKNHQTERKHKKIIYTSIIITLAFSIFTTAIYFLFPNLIVTVLFGAYYTPIIPYLGWVGGIFIFYSLVNLLVLYFLSINKTRFLPFLCVGTLTEIFLISYFHQNIWEIIFIMLGVMVCLTISLFIFLFTKNTNEKTA
jgi:O-antigen/teichoic acid export membrane protein